MAPQPAIEPAPERQPCGVVHDPAVACVACHELNPSRRGMAPLTVEEALALPALVGPEMISRIWGHRSPSQFHRLDKQGAFDFLKVTPAVGPKRFSGVLIARYLCGEPLYIPTFGRKGARR